MKTTRKTLMFMLLLGVLTGQSALFGAGAAGAGPGAGRERHLGLSAAEAAEVAAATIRSARAMGPGAGAQPEEVRDPKKSSPFLITSNDKFSIFIGKEGTIINTILRDDDPVGFKLFKEIKLLFDLTHVFARCGDIDRLKIVLKSYRKINENKEYFERLSEGEKLHVSKWYPAYDVPTAQGETPLMLALINGHLKTADYLYNQGANISRKRMDGKSIEEICQATEETKKWFHEKTKLATEQYNRILDMLRAKGVALPSSTGSATGKDVAPCERKLCAGPGAGMPEPKSKAVNRITKTLVRKQRKAANKIARELEAQKAVLKAEEDAKKESERKAKSAKRATLSREIGELSEAMKLLEKTWARELREYQKRLEEQKAAEKAAHEAKALEEARAAHETALAAAKAEATISDITSRFSGMMAPSAHEDFSSRFRTDEELRQERADQAREKYEQSLRQFVLHEELLLKQKVTQQAAR